MPQETNLNVAPYFDDFDPQKDYYKVLFKPGYPVQARELTTLQSVLQNQIEKFGTHFFKEGEKIIPGQLTYLNNYYAVEIESQFLGINVEEYLDQLIGKTIRGETSGVVAKVVSYITDIQSERSNFTLYVDYIETSSSNLSDREFFDGEVLITDESINFLNTFITAGEGFASTIATDSTSTGSAFALGEGIYFLRGYFVQVDDEILILDQYANTPSYRVGLLIDEDVISSELDSTLNDNAQGFNNYAAPGADRLRIRASLAKKDLNDFDDQNFVQLATVENGILREGKKTNKTSELTDELARRTFDESGHYYVKRFRVDCKESLNDGYGNRGIYNENQQTSGGSTPSDSLAIYKIGPGKAYVRGYEIETRSPSFIDVPKPRTTRLAENQAINFSFGPTIVVNNVTGSPRIGFNTGTTLQLRDQRVGIDSFVAAGNEIGIARVYDFALESGSYDSSNLNINQWDLSLFDIQTYTNITLNEAVNLSLPVHVKGRSSGATGFLRYPSTGVAITAYQVNGQFFNGEELIFNGISDGSRVSVAVTNKNLSDVKSIFGSVGFGGTFSADLLQVSSRVIGIASISSASSGISTITTSAVAFPGIVTTGNLIRYSRPGFTDKSFARVTSVQTNTITVTGVTTVTGVCDGGLSATSLSLTDLTVLKSNIPVSAGSGNFAGNNSIFSVFPKKNIATVDTSSSSLIIRKSVTVDITDGSTTTISAGTNEVFLPFDEERYSLIRSDGTLEVLTEDRFEFTVGSTQLTINGLGSNDTGATLITTRRKSNITSKVKRKKIVDSIVINKSKYQGSGVGNTTLNDGLTYGNYPFGTRIQDETISLNVPDVIRIYGVFESENSSDPTSPSMSLGSMDGPSATTNDLIIGEEITGKTSGAKAIYITRNSDTNIGFIYENSISFEVGEVVTFSQSGVNAIASSDLSVGSKNITSNYRFSNGQNLTYYDYSRIIRRSGASEPTRRLKVFFSKGYYDSSDTGDITTVESYNSFEYGSEIATINSIRNTDIVDARPRVINYTVSEGANSPFEFNGRSFNAGSTGQHSSKDVIASDESITLSYTYYLPRIDRLYLDKDGIFIVKFGAPDDNPKLPEEVSGAMNIANIFLPAYLYSAQQVRIDSVDHKRYQMNDIFKLERRIKNLEYYTSLSNLETNTLNLFVSDANGLNRFKSGIFVDGFLNRIPQDSSIGVKNSVDIRKAECRPSHYTTALNLEIGSTSIAGIGTTTIANQDKRFADILGTNIKRSNSVVTLNYSDTSWLKQPFATRTESVTPFFVKFWQGTLEFEPTVDVWIDVNRQVVNSVEMEGSFLGIAEAMRAEVTTAADGSRSGISPVIWQSWETTGVDVSFSLSSSQSSSSSSSTSLRQGSLSEFRDSTADRSSATSVPQTFLVEEETTDTTTSTTISGTVGVDLQQQRRGTQTTVTEQIDTESLGDRITSRNIINFMRSRNIEFTGRRLKPFTQVYPFFDNVDVNSFCFSKLLEIEMSSGTFQVGETVIGFMPSTQTTPNVDTQSSPTIIFRVSTPNHKYGPYNNPTDIFERNPYDRENQISTLYSASSTILNIDTFSLADESQPNFRGNVRTGMLLRGQSSGAEATVSNVRLVTDRLGTIIGSFLVPNGNNASNPIFETGRTRFRLTSSSIDSKVPGVVTTSAEEIFYSQGDIDNTQEVTLSLRNARVDHNDNFLQTRTIGDSASSSTTFVSGTDSSTRLTGEYRDPLAQSFIVDDETGIFVTKIDLYFAEKSNDLPVTVQIREVELGTPSQKILPYSEVELSPDQVNTSSDASIATTFEFESPVYLEGQREYAIIIISNSTEYTVWISRLGESDISTLGTERGQILVSTQRLLGSLFKSQNASTWTPSQYEDLTFELYRANFVSSGSVQFFNPELSKDLELLTANPITMTSNTVRIGIGTTVNDQELTIGNTILQNGVNVSGKLVGYGGTATGNLNITNAGVGYTPSSGSLTYSGVALTSVIGNGVNATADIHINNGVAIGATIINGGTGYTVGDIVSPIQIGSNSLGNGMRLSISQLSGQNQLIVSNIQGEFETGVGKSIQYINNAGVTTDLNGQIGGNVLAISPITEVSDGLHFKVFQRNHGMHSGVNKVTISNVQSDTTPTTLSANYLAAATGNISVASTSNFGTFENVSIGATNPGYALIGNEIISYTGVAANALTGVTRQIDGTKAFSYLSGDLVYKYELNGVSLRRINKTHTLSDATVSDPRSFDFYNVKVDMTSNGIDRSSTVTMPELHFNETKIGGGIKARSTYNVQYELITPNVRVISPTGTGIVPSVRTITGRSVGGSEAGYVDKGFKQISLNQANYFDSPRMVASRVNENEYLTSLPGNKSFTMNLNLTTSDSRISPAIDLQSNSIIFTSNRVNSPVSNYATDFRVNDVVNDPNAFYYVTKNVTLENPATSIQVIVDGYVSNYSDLRAFYAVDQETQVNETIFVPFPGYQNINVYGNVINPSINNGQSSSLVPKVDEYAYEPSGELFKEYKFTIDNLQPFKFFRIKLIGTSTNQAFVPVIKNFRVIALA